jgi:cyclopropane-fatty-acyl-phospholipid synthase
MDGSSRSSTCEGIPHRKEAAAKQAEEAAEEAAQAQDLGSPSSSSSSSSALAEAQLRKLYMIASKLRLTPGMTVLDIGCGFGSLAKFLSSEYKVRVVGVTISASHRKYGQGHFAHPAVTLIEKDYRELTLQDLPERGVPVDRIVSVGMFEHVGPSNYATFFAACARLLNPQTGLMLLHTIGAQSPSYGPNPLGDPWLDRYIFPQSCLPGMDQIANMSRPYFHIEDVHNFGLSYAKTLAAWAQNLDKKGFWQRANKEQTAPFCNVQFQRMWRFYLTSCQAVFLTRQAHLWQFLMSPTSGAASTVQADWARTIHVMPPQTPRV